MKKMILWLAIAALGFAGIADATLINRGVDSLGNRLIYDTDLNITWYDYTKVYDTWQNQVNWASNLSVTFGSQTFDDWRLPDTVEDVNGSIQWGYNITSSEMGHLYYTDLGNLGYTDTTGQFQPGWGLKITGPFEHLLSEVYWSGTEYSDEPDLAWYFLAGNGFQDVGSSKNFNLMYALAVRPGDVVAAQHTNPVPEPGTWMLLGSGLVGLAAFRRKFARR